MPHPQSLRAHLSLLVVVALWGATFVLVKGALADASPLLFNLLRMSLAFLCLVVFYRKHLRSLSREALLAGSIVGACLAAGYQFQTAGLARTTPSKSAFITGLIVVLVPLMAVVPWLRSAGVHQPRWNAWLGALLAFAGVVLLTTPGGVAWAVQLASINSGDLLTLGCAVGFSLHVLALAHFSPRMDLAQLATLQIGFAALYMLLTLPLERPLVLHLSLRLVVAVLIAAVLATAAAFTIQSWAQRFLPATHTALILSLEPVFAWITSFLVLGEGLHARAAMGATLILLGIAVTELFPASVPATAHEGI